MENLRGDFICRPACEQIGINNITALLDESQTLEISEVFFDQEEKCRLVSIVIKLV